MKEAQLLHSLRHPNIISVFAVWPVPTGTVFITELLSSGSIRTYIKGLRDGKVSSNAVTNWGRQILEGLQYLHEHSVIHRDLKCDNIFVNGHKGEVKIGDFGLSCASTGGELRSVIGTPEFMAPEIYDENYTNKVDVYAFGMCLLEMVTGALPYAECENCGQVFKKVTEGRLPNSLLSLEESPVKEIISLCTKSADERPSCADLLMRPYFANREATDNRDKPVIIPNEKPRSGLMGISEQLDRDCEKLFQEYSTASSSKPIDSPKITPAAVQATEEHINDQVHVDKLQELSECPDGDYTKKLSSLRSNHVKILQKVNEFISNTDAFDKYDAKVIDTAEARVLPS
eukprot:TRINITY_DN534_c5_g1_i1.p1 TRINITY_DN534_c5_g1~~TRINITY_DN534_c5_g1_i1.p1  ORF type:complete len:344 (+),score=63.88 TRINITY_DN534_c5_g1_i1:207-1238(+)